MNYFTQIKKAIQAYILVECTKVDSKDKLSHDWIEGTYQDFLYGKQELIVSEGEQGRLLSFSSLSEAQSQKLAMLSLGKKHERIADLFCLLNHTELFYGLVTCLESMFKASGWVLLLTGKLSLSALVVRLKAHQLLCHDRLDFKKTGLRDR